MHMPEALLRTACRHVHAKSMALHRDREALAEEFHRVLCDLDPSAPGYVTTPIARDTDALTLAYAILLMREGKFQDEVRGLRLGFFKVTHSCTFLAIERTNVAFYLYG